MVPRRHQPSGRGTARGDSISARHLAAREGHASYGGGHGRDHHRPERIDPDSRGSRTKPDRFASEGKKFAMNEAFGAARIVLALMAAGVTLPGSLELILVTVGGILPQRRTQAPRRILKHVVCVIPAHDEAKGIARCVRSLLVAAAVRAAEIVVIADNCTDQTAAVARTAGARVIERNDAAQRGKGCALEFAFARLIAEGADAFLVVDADSRVAPNFTGVMSAV